MNALIAVVVCMALSMPLILILGRGGSYYSRELPWNLNEVAGRQVTIAGGLAGFAITGMVLLVTLARDRAEVRTDSFNATVFMFLTAYLFFVGTAFLFSFLPRTDADGSQPARMQFALAAGLQFRSVMIAWFALRPLMETFGLDVLTNFAGGAITFSLWLGGLFVIAIFYGITVITLRQAIMLPVIATAAMVSVTVLLLTVFPGLESTKSTLYLTAALYGLNVVTFMHFSCGLLAGMFEPARMVFQRYSATMCLLDIQCTMVLLTFMWMAVIGIL